VMRFRESDSLLLVEREPFCGDRCDAWVVAHHGTRLGRLSQSRAQPFDGPVGAGAEAGVDSDF
jgi:hypothetical protein